MLEVILSSLETLGLNFIGILPILLAALIVLIIGWLIAIALGSLVERIIKVVKLDTLLDRIGFKKVLAKSNIRLNSGKFFGEITKWFFIIVFLMAATDILGLFQITAFLNGILLYIPNVIIAIIVLLIAIIVAHFLQNFVKASIKTAGLHSAGFLSSLTKWAVFAFGFIIALTQLGIAVTLINTLVMGLVGMLALAGGLAFGLGGKDQAARFLENIRREIEES